MPTADINDPAQSLELLKQVLDMTGTLAVILDQDARIVYFNPQSQKVTGFSSEELLNKKMSETLIREPQREGFISLLRLVMKGKTVDHEGYWHTTKDDKYICVHSTISRFGSSAAPAPWITVTGMNITAKKRIEHALQNSEAQLRAIHDAAVDGIVTIDEKGVIENLNKAAASMFGYSNDELVGQNVKVLMPSPDRERHDQYLQNFRDTGIAKIIGIGREVTGVRKDGSSFPIDLAVSEIELPERRMFTAILHDISERKEVEQAARLRLTEHAHASRLAALGEMASGIAHELNQPLAAIVSFADASKRILGSEDKRIDVIEDTLTQIAQQGERAGNIIRRLREFVRKGSVEQQDIYINKLVSDVLNMLEYDLRMQQVDVIRRFQEDAPRVKADKLQIEQVVLNLLRNAIDAMEQSKSRALTVTTDSDGDYIYVSVNDTGPGFDKDQTDQLFDAFYTTKPQGTGLGLSISHSIIAAHGGNFTANSSDRGATFRFSLPVT